MLLAEGAHQEGARPASPELPLHCARNLVTAARDLLKQRFLHGMRAIRGGARHGPMPTSIYTECNGMGLHT